MTKNLEGWMAPEARQRIRLGNAQDLLRAVVMLAETWTREAHVPLEDWPFVRHSHVAGCIRKPMTLETPDAVRRAFLAAGCDLLDILALSQHGRQAIAFLCPSALVDDVEHNQHPDDAAVDRFATSMKMKLARKRTEGRHGWDDETQCSGAVLSALLREHVAKGDPVDVANFCMMLHQRGERISDRSDG